VRAIRPVVKACLVKPPALSLSMSGCRRLRHTTTPACRSHDRVIRSRKNRANKRRDAYFYIIFFIENKLFFILSRTFEKYFSFIHGSSIYPRQTIIFFFI
jgi:hypothetical protein